MAFDPIRGVPTFRPVKAIDLKEAFSKGWRDFRAFPLYGLLFAGFYVLANGVDHFCNAYHLWLVLAAIGFPLFGPFAAVGLYEISRRQKSGLKMSDPSVFGVVLQQRLRQLPSICSIIVFIFLFWFFIGHMISALFLGLSQMTNIHSSLDVLLSSEGLTMLVMGSAIGTLVCLLSFMITVFALPFLLEREIDFVTAMITSFQQVQANFSPMVLWGMFVVAVLILSMIPAFFGLLITLPVLGHASWHLYSAIRIADE